MSVVQHLRKLISIFYKNYLNKLIVISSTINTAILMARLTKALAMKQKYGRPAKANSTDKQAKKNSSSKPSFFCQLLSLSGKKIYFLHLPLSLICPSVFAFQLIGFFINKLLKNPSVFLYRSLSSFRSFFTIFQFCLSAFLGARRLSTVTLQS